LKGSHQADVILLGSGSSRRKSIAQNIFARNILSLPRIDSRAETAMNAAQITNAFKSTAIILCN
jgi:hypothetical protein